MPRRRRDRTAVQAVREQHEELGSDRCAVCGWRPPRALADLGVERRSSLLHLHHVVPHSCGGSDDADNLVLLCPNHHAIAHQLGRIQQRPTLECHSWDGPQTKEHLLHELQLLGRRDQSEWRRWVANGRDWDQHVRDEFTRQTRSFTVITGSQPR